MARILIVDDELSSSEVLALALEDEGYEVVTAPNGKEGLERLEKAKPDLIVTDLMMPLMNGAEMGRAIRAAPAHQDIPIIMTSSVAEDAVRSRFGGYQAYLRKPFSIVAILETIEALLKRSG